MHASSFPCVVVGKSMAMPARTLRERNVKRGFGTNEPASPRQIAWRRSARFKAQGRAACLKFNARRRAAPKCEALKRSDGQPCQNPAGPNGRCRLHGGATPSGKQWHVVQYPTANTPASAAKFEKKLQDRDRLARKLAKRLAAMGPAERARYDDWCRTYHPGPKSQRQAAKRQAAQNADTRALLAAPGIDVPPSLELQRIQAAIAEIDRRLGQAEQPVTTYTEGVFG